MITNIAGDSRRIVQDLRTRQPNLVKKATVTALNRANAKVLTESRRAVASETGIPQKHIKSKFRKYNARRNNMRASVWMGLKGKVSLAAVNTGKKINGKWSKYLTESLQGVPVTSAFRATVGRGHNSIFVRSMAAKSATGTDSKGRPRKNRLPMREVVLRIDEPAKRAINSAGNTHARPAFEKSIRHELQRRQRGIGR